MTPVVITGAFVLVWAALGCVYWYATRDLGTRAAPRSWRRDSIAHRIKRWRLARNYRRAVKREAGQPLRVLPSFPQPPPLPPAPRPSPFERPLIDWLRDSVTFEARELLAQLAAEQDGE